MIDLFQNSELFAVESLDSRTPFYLIPEKKLAIAKRGTYHDSLAANIPPQSVLPEAEMLHKDDLLALGFTIITPPDTVPEWIPSPHADDLSVTQYRNWQKSLRVATPLSEQPVPIF